MAWWKAASIAAPLLAGALTPRPKVPGYMGRQKFMTPEEEARYNQFLESAFSPQSELQRLAAEQASANTAANLSRMGLAGSSLALQADRAAQADLANKFLENELARRQMGLNAMYGKAKMELGIGDQMRGAAMDQYRDDFNKAAGLVKGIGTAASTYAGYRAHDDLMAQREADRKFMQSMMMTPRATMGVPIQPQSVGVYGLDYY